MTRSKGIGRGIGGGRPRKNALAVISKSSSDVPPKGDRESDPECASELKGLALKALKQILKSSQSDASRVAAAKEVLNRCAEGDAPKGTGKKAQAAEAAKGAGAGTEWGDDLNSDEPRLN